MNEQPLVQSTKQDQKKCPACGQKGYDCQVWEYSVNCEHEGRRLLTEDEKKFWEEQVGWSTTD